eukprot:1155616-Pelagomonas_calceolata.AAC.16
MQQDVGCAPVRLGSDGALHCLGMRMHGMLPGGGGRIAKSGGWSCRVSVGKSCRRRLSAGCDRCMMAG